MHAHTAHEPWQKWRHVLVGEIHFIAIHAPRLKVKQRIEPRKQVAGQLLHNIFAKLFGYSGPRARVFANTPCSRHPCQPTPF
jgi:hypothetical protein